MSFNNSNLPRGSPAFRPSLAPQNAASLESYAISDFGGPIVFGSSPAPRPGSLFTSGPAGGGGGGSARPPHLLSFASGDPSGGGSRIGSTLLPPPGSFHSEYQPSPNMTYQHSTNPPPPTSTLSTTQHHQRSSSFNDSFSMHPAPPPPSGAHYGSVPLTPSTGGGYQHHQPGSTMIGGGSHTAFPAVLPGVSSTPLSRGVGGGGGGHEPFGGNSVSSAIANDAVLELYNVAHAPPSPQQTNPSFDESSDDNDDDVVPPPPSGVTTTSTTTGTSTRDMGTTMPNHQHPTIPAIPRGLLLIPHTCCNFKWSLYYGMEIRCLGSHFTFDMVLYFLSAIFIGIMWLALWTALPPELTEPAGAILGPASTIIVCTFFGQYIFARNLQLPPALGTFLCSIIWNHIYEVGFLSQGTFKALRFVVGKVGLTTILIRSGLALDWKSIKPTVFRTTALATLPFSIETIISAVLAFTLFSDQYQQDWRWALLHGFMASVIAAGLIVPEMLGLIAAGYNKGVPPLAISAVGFDTALGVWAINFMIQMIFSDQEIGILAALGPAQLVGGAILGVLIGFLFTLLMRLLRRNMWRNPTAMRRFTLGYFVAISVTVVVFGERFNLAGGGTILALAFSASFGHMIQHDAKVEEKQLEAKRAKHAAALQAKIYQERQQQQHQNTNTNNGNDDQEMTRMMTVATTAPYDDDGGREGVDETATTFRRMNASNTTGASSGVGSHPPVEIDITTVPLPPRHHRVAAEQRHHLMLDLRDFWNFIVAGPLFSLAGALVNVPKLVSLAFLPKGLLILGVGAVVRSIVTALTVSCGLGLSWREIAFLPMAWIGKGAVQAATGGIALEAAVSKLEALAANATQAERSLAEQNVVAGQTIVNTAALYILISAPLCSLLISRMAPKMLRKPEDMPLNPQ